MNFRIGFCVLIAMIASIIFANCVFVSQRLKLAWILIIIGIFLLLLICFAIFGKKFLLVFAVVVLSGVIPATSIYFKANKLEKNKQLLQEEFVFCGKISEINENLKNNKISLYLTDVEIINEDGESSDFYGKVYVGIYSDSVDTSTLKIGRKIYAKDDGFRAFTLNEGSSETDRSFIANGVTASSFLFFYEFDVEENENLSLREKIKAKVFSAFEKTDVMYTNIGYAMIFGESEVLDDAVYDIFQNTGIAHLLAVSGFHISVIVSVLSMVLDKLKTNKYLKFGIIGTILFLYAYLCSFSVSVIRASIMALLLIYATNRSKEYDRLSALSFAGILILLISPMQVFGLSFELSFISVLSIILLMPMFKRLLSKFLNENFSSALSLSLSVCLGTSIFQLYYFGVFPVFSIFANLITIPIVSVLFIFLLVSVALGGIFNILVPLINTFGLCIKYVVRFNNWISSIGIYVNAGKFNAIALLLSIVLMFAVSDYVFVKKRTKIISSAVLAAVLVLLMI